VTMPPRPGAPFPFTGGRSLDPERDPTDPWLETLRERMLGERTVFVSGFLDDSVASRAALELMTLDAAGDDAVKLHIDCPGAALEPAFALMDVIDAMGVDVHAMCVGQAVGPAVGVLAVCHERSATSHCRLRLVDPPLELSGRPRDIDAGLEDHKGRMRRFCERLAEVTGQPADAIRADMGRGLYMSAEEAKEYGLLDKVVSPDARVLPFPRRLGFRP
jgi:ATP-dependent Clp protease, protease subunit